MAFTRGYILACEDVIRDLDFMGTKSHPTAHLIKMKVKRSLDEAQRGLKVILEDEDGSRSEATTS